MCSNFKNLNFTCIPCAYFKRKGRMGWKDGMINKWANVYEIKILKGKSQLSVESKFVAKEMFVSKNYQNKYIGWYPNKQISEIEMHRNNCNDRGKRNQRNITAQGLWTNSEIFIYKRCKFIMAASWIWNGGDHAILCIQN